MVGDEPHPIPIKEDPEFGAKGVPTLLGVQSTVLWGKTAPCPMFHGLGAQNAEARSGGRSLEAGLSDIVVPMIQEASSKSDGQVHTRLPLQSEKPM